MPDTVGLTFTPRTDPLVAFASVGALNEFFAAITVVIPYTSMPPASVDNLGGVFLVSLLNIVYTPVVPAYNTIANDEGSVEVVTPATIDELNNRIAGIAAYIAELKAALNEAGILEE